MEDEVYYLILGFSMEFLASLLLFREQDDPKTDRAHLHV